MLIIYTYHTNIQTSNLKRAETKPNLDLILIPTFLNRSYILKVIYRHGFTYHLFPIFIHNIILNF